MKKKKSIAALTFMMLLMMLALSACGSSGTEETAAMQTTEAQQEETEKETEKEPEEEIEEETGNEQQTMSEEALDMDGSDNMETAPEMPLYTKVNGSMPYSNSSDTFSWYYFITESAKDAVYEFSIGKDASSLTFNIYDEKGNDLFEFDDMKEGGITTVIRIEGLKPETKYFVRLKCPIYKNPDYTISVIRNASAVSGSYKIGEAEPDEDIDSLSLTGSTEDEAEEAVTFISGEKQVATDTEDIRGGTNMNDAVFLPLETRIHGSCENGVGMWYAFTTASADNSEVYRITTVNKTVESGDLYAEVFDGLGNSFGGWYADQGGCFNTKNFELAPNTTYYLWIKGRSHSTGRDHTDYIDFMLIVREENRQTTAYATTDSFFEARGANEAMDGNIYPMTNADDAYVLPLDMQIGGKVHDGLYSWFAFETDSADNAETYSVSAVHQTIGAGDLYIGVYDKYGECLGKWYARNDGVMVTQEFELEPDSTYYIMVCGRSHSTGRDHTDTIEYTFTINSPQEQERDVVVIGKTEAEPLVFETPFELNETQVMFVAESDEFIDPDAAKAAVEPVAEAILAYPDHSILIAGTTATDGSQKARVELSNRRAAAVKDLLVSEYKVPKSQIQTIGLGYEADPFERAQDRVIPGDINSNFIETEGAKNRRVVIMDIEDPIAQEILSAS